MKAHVTLENAVEIVEDFDLSREYDKVKIAVATGAVYQLSVTRDGNLKVYCSEGPGIFGPALTVQGQSSNVIVIAPGRDLT